MRNILKVYLTVLVLLTSCFVKGEKPGLPNIILILADDLGYGDISGLNAKSKIQTSNIDKIGKSGVTFTDAHSSSSVCTPTRYGLLTGRYNWRSTLKNGVLGVYDKPLLTESRTNMAGMLKKQGYQTACIGKWHLGWLWPTTDNQKPVDTPNSFNLDFSRPIIGGPTDIGFDYYFGTDVPNYPPYCFIENRRTIGLPSRYYDEFAYEGNRPGRGIPNWNQEQILPTLQQKAIGYIADASKKPNPFFLYLPLTAPHTPIAPSKHFQGKSGLNAYADLVLEVDHLVGEITQALEDNHIAKNTILVFTSDNGCSPQADFPFLTGKGHFSSYIYRGQKSDLFEGGHRIPLLFQWPEKIKTSHTINQITCLNDMMSTFAAVTDYKLADNEAEDSYNLLPALLNPGYGKIIREATVHHSINGSFTIRKGEWKLLLAAGSGGWSFPKPGKEEEGLPPVQLYNLNSDPGEQNNIWQDHPGIVTELKELLKRYITDGRSTPGTPQKNDGPYPWKQVSAIFPELIN